MLKSMTFRSTLAAVACAISISAHAMADPAKQIDVPAGDLIPALESLEKQAAIELVFQPDQLKSFHTKGVKGMFQPEAAIKILLKGTPLELRTDPTGAMVVAPPHSKTLSNNSASPGETGAAQRGEPTRGSDSKGDVQSKSFWDRFRLAQVDQGASSVSSSSSSKKKDSSNSATAETDKSTAKLEEIIVTAQKRSENLQRVPVSLQVIGSEQLEEQNQNSLTDLTRTVPGVHISTGNVSNSLSIRGIGSGRNNPGFDQSVAIFADDIYRGRSRMSAATFLDLDRIEILKGPQSTFFGNNAIAGALSIISKKPGDTVGGYVRALGGMFEQYASEGAVGGPITDTLQARFAAGATGNERGWLNNLNTGEHIPRIHDIAGRLTLVYKPTEALDATLKLEGDHHKTEGTWLDQPSQWVNCPYPNPPFPTSFGGNCSGALAQGEPVGLDKKDVSFLRGTRNQLSNEEAVLTLNYRVGNQTLTSVTGYSYYDYLADIGGLPKPTVEVESLEHYHQFSQELRLASPTGQPIEYLAGAYFQTDQLVSDYIATSPSLNSIFPLILPPITPYLPYAVRNGILQREHIYSVFGSLAWNATDRLKLSASIRGSQVDKDYNAHLLYGTSTQLYGGFVEDPQSIQQLISSTFKASLGTSPQLSQSNHALMPSARIQYQFNPDVMAYFRYDRGFLAGGFNGSSVIDFSHIAQFGPEHVNDYEVGLKSKWRDDTVLLNLNLFRADYTDLQVSTIKFVYDPIHGTYSPISDLTNAAKSRSQGVELEGQWLPMKNLSLGANVAYLKAYYVSYPNSNPNTLQQYCAGPGARTPYCLAQFPAGVPQVNGVHVNDLTGQATAYAPRWSGSLTAAYGIMLPRDFRLTTELDPYFTTNYSNISGDPIFSTGGYVRWDARLAFGPQDGRWSIDLIGKNLTDRTIVVDHSDLYLVSKEQPRNVALQFRYHF